MMDGGGGGSVVSWQKMLTKFNNWVSFSPWPAEAVGWSGTENSRFAVEKTPR